MRLLSVVCTLACVLGAAGPTRADVDERSKAKALYNAGIAHYNLAEFKDALDSFKEAYRVHHDPVLLFNIAQCHRQLGEFAAAATFYRSYRRESPDAANRADVDRLIRDMDRAVQEERARQPPPTTQPLDKMAPGATQPLPSAARPTVTEAGAPNLVATAPPPRPLVKRPWFWATVAGAAVVVAGAVALGVVYGVPGRDPSPTAGKVNGN
jgi:hypothetical protein